MSCNPELCASCGEISFGILRDLCPSCREFPLENLICREILAECLGCKKCKQEGEIKCLS
jgi:hypothetical protein